MVTAAGKFADGTLFFELAEHFEQRIAVRPFEVETATDIVGGGWIGPNLQKTKDVIGAEVRGASHKLGPPEEICGRGGFYSLFFDSARNFFLEVGLHSAGQHTTGCPPSVRAVGHSPKGEPGRRDDLARLSFFMSA